ncbi:Helitron helicase-like domain containing protein [Gracilaria domingensis]|nr:Helitron helicase-like domain containing protein [Gracilaria domingensis]
MRMVEERELQQGTHSGTDELGPPGKLYLPGNHKNSPAYWKQKRLDVQAMVARMGSPTFFITVTMNVWREEMKRFGLDNDNTGAFSPQGNRSRPFDRPDLVARVYNQYANSIMTDLHKNSEAIFGLKCIGIAAKLEFQERNTPHHHILLWLEGGTMDDPEIIDSLIKAELPRGQSQEDQELRALVKRFNIHRHSPYCRGRTRNETTIEDLTNRVTYRRRTEEDLKVVPYNPDLTRKYKAHINVERTQGGTAVAYLMKYAFKPGKEHDVFITSRESRSTDQRGSERELESEIRAYMRSRVVGAVEAAWNLFEFRHVRIDLCVQALDVHLPEERQVLVRNTRLPRSLKSSMLERCFKRPSEYSNLDYLSYYESVRLYDKLPRSIPERDASLDSGRPPKFIVDRDEESASVARIRFVSPGNLELFALRILLMNAAFSSFEDAKKFHGETHTSYRDAAIARGILVNENEYETAFN